MPDTLSPEISKRVRALCEGILGDLNMPDTAIEELEGHFQDRMLGYLSGADPLSEEDALLLTQEHFGDAQTVRELFAEATPGTNREAGHRWFLAGAALMVTAFVLSMGGLPAPGIERGVGAVHFLDMPFFVASLVLLGLALILVRHAHITTTDRIFGWYSLAFLLGNLLLLVRVNGVFAQLSVMPLSMGLMILQLAMMLGVAVSFFHHLTWGRWLLLALLLLPFLTSVTRGRLDDEMRAAMNSHTQDQVSQPAQPNAEASQQAAVTVTHVATKTVEVPPKGFSQAFYVLALLHAFLPRRSGRHVSVHASRATDIA